MAAYKIIHVHFSHMTLNVDGLISCHVVSCRNIVHIIKQIKHIWIEKEESEENNLAKE